jgi:Transposase.
MFWNAKGILLIGCLEKGKTITAKYYSNLLKQLDVRIHEKRSDLKKKIVHQTMHLSLVALTRNCQMMPSLDIFT